MRTWTLNTTRALTRDGWLLFGSRSLRLFAYGALSVVLVLYLVQAGLDEARIGLLLSLTLLGDTLVSLWLTTRADRWGRRRTLLVGAVLMALAGVVFALTDNFLLLVVAAIIGVISPSGGEIGPFLAVEQAALSQTTPGSRRTGIFAWYNLAGSLATASGALAGGWLAQALQNSGTDALTSYRVVLSGYVLVAAALALLSTRMSPAVETSRSHQAAASPIEPRRWLGLHRSRGIVLQLSALFAVDAFAGGFIVQSWVAYWFALRFGIEPALLGALFFGTNLLAGISALAAARVAARFGLINTMVWTHLPSNVLLMLVPLMPTLPLAVTLLLVRSSISQMDVPTRQSYTMAVVEADERSAAAGVTGVARTVGASVAPALTGLLMSNPVLVSLPFFFAGGLKILYDLTLYRLFRQVRPPEEQPHRSVP
ncbi:MAG: MFS transporter [Caldilineaceae bacterium]|nr:MFS transporter [Caldilineaceae bacterium]